MRIVDRQVTEEDRKTNRYFDHMAGLEGTIQNIYGNDEIAVKIDPERMSAVTTDVHRVSVERMRKKFVESVSEEQKKSLSPEELNFEANYVLLVRGEDLQPVG